MTRWIRFFFAILVGIALGLVYGWFIQPGKFSDTSLDSLRIDYKTDYVLMVAEAYQIDNDPLLAVQRLAASSEKLPTAQVEESIKFAKKVGYTEPDINRMQALLSTLGGATPDQGDLKP